MANTNIQEELFQAIDTIIQQRIANLPYDKTIECEIINDSQSSIGTYTVKYQAVTFEVTSNITGLKKGDIVYVSVPQNDFTKDKILLAKKPKAESSTSKSLPFLSFIHGNNLLSQFQREKQSIAYTNSGSETVNITTIVDFEGQQVAAGYTRLGLKVTLNSAIAANMKSGDYGIKIILYGYNQMTNSQSSGDLIALEKDAMNDEKYYKELYLKIEDMITVNPYNTNGAQNQEKVFDITGWVIDTITISLWQDNNFFDTKGVAINDQSLLATNLELYLGYDKVDFENSNNNVKMFLYTPDGLLYNGGNKIKNIYSRFLKISDQDANKFEDFSDSINKDNSQHNYTWENFNSTNTSTSTISNQVGFEIFLPENTTIANSYAAEINYSEIKNGYCLLYEDKTKFPVYHFVSNTLWFVREDFQELISDLMTSGYHQSSLEEQIASLEKEYQAKINTLKASDFKTNTEYVNKIKELNDELKQKIEELQTQQSVTEVKGTMQLRGKELIFKTEDGIIILRLSTNGSQLVGNASTASGYARDGIIYQNLKAIETALNGSYTVI